MTNRVILTKTVRRSTVEPIIILFKYIYRLTNLTSLIYKFCSNKYKNNKIYTRFFFKFLFLRLFFIRALFFSFGSVLFFGNWLNIKKKNKKLLENWWPKSIFKDICVSLISNFIFRSLNSILEYNHHYYWILVSQVTFTFEMGIIEIILRFDLFTNRISHFPFLFFSFFLFSLRLREARM